MKNKTTLCNFLFKPVFLCVHTLWQRQYYVYTKLFAFSSWTHRKVTFPSALASGWAHMTSSGEVMYTTSKSGPWQSSHTFSSLSQSLSLSVFLCFPMYQPRHRTPKWQNHTKIAQIIEAPLRRGAWSAPNTSENKLTLFVTESSKTSYYNKKKHINTINPPCLYTKSSERRGGQKVYIQGRLD